MKYLHRFSIDENTTAYVVSTESQRPQTMTLSQKKWEGRAVGGNARTVMGQIAGLSFTKEMKEPKKDLPEETPELKKKKASIVEELDKIACELQAQGESQVALALDQVSDFLDEREAARRPIMLKKDVVRPTDTDRWDIPKPKKKNKDHDPAKEAKRDAFAKKHEPRDGDEQLHPDERAIKCPEDLLYPDEWETPRHGRGYVLGDGAHYDPVNDTFSGYTSEE